MTQSLQKRVACAQIIGADNTILVSFTLYYHSLKIHCFCYTTTETKATGTS